jgi:hypothetical protein
MTPSASLITKQEWLKAQGLYTLKADSQSERKRRIGETENLLQILVIHTPILRLDEVERGDYFSRLLEGCRWSFVH